MAFRNLSSYLQKIAQPSLLGTLALGTGAVFSIQVLGTGLVYVSHVLFARWMGASEYGAFVYAFSWTNLLTLLSGLGLTTAVLRFIPSYQEEQDWARLHGVIRRSRLLTCSTGVFFAVLGTIFLMLVNLQKINSETLLMGFWLIPLLSLVSMQKEVIRGFQHMVLAYAPPIVIQPALTLVVAFIVLQASGSVSSMALMGATAFAILSVLLVQVWGLGKTIPEEAKVTKATYETEQWLRVAFPLLLMAGFTIVLDKADILMLGILLGQKEAGIYNAATKTATLASFVMTVVNAVAGPMISSLYAKKDHAALQKLVKTVVQWMFLPSLVITLLLVGFGEHILSLFGSEFTEARLALGVLALGNLVFSCVGPVIYLLSLTGHQNLSARVYGSCALLNVLLNTALIPLWGLGGAAVATTITMMVWSIWLCVLVKKHLGISSYIFAPT